MFLKGETGKDSDDYPINIEFQNSTFKVLVTLKANYWLDLIASNYHQLLGFDKVILKDKNNYGLRLPT